MIRRPALPAQLEVLRDLSSPESVFVSGLGGGKTWTGCEFVISRQLMNGPNIPALVVAPTWRKSIERIVVPSFRKAFGELGIPWVYHSSKGSITWGFPGRRFTIWLASGENPDLLKGPNVGCVWIDEPAIQDRKVYENAGSRVRGSDVKVGQVLLTGTHEGLGWFHKLTKSGVRVVHSTSLDNPFTGEAYVARLMRLYPDENRRKMYIYGIATALEGGIYTMLRPHHFRLCRDPSLSGAPFVSWDFNVDHMVTELGGRMRTHLHFFDEVVSTGGVLTQVHAQRVVERLLGLGVARYDYNPSSGTRSLMATCGTGQVEAVIDASASQRHPSSLHTDEEIVRQAGFRVLKFSDNPYVSDRIQTMQSCLATNKFFIDEARCPNLATAVREHSYDPKRDPPTPQKRFREGELQLDHYTDAAGYACCHFFPIARGGVEVS